MVFRLWCTKVGHGSGIKQSLVSHGGTYKAERSVSYVVFYVVGQPC